MKKLLTQEESMIPGLFYNFKRALIPLMHDETYDAMNRVQDLVEANSYATKVKNTIASKQLKAAAGGVVNIDEDDDFELPGQNEVSAAGVDTKNAEKASAIEPSASENSVVDSILSAPPTCEPGSRYCAPCYELA